MPRKNKSPKPQKKESKVTKTAPNPRVVRTIEEFRAKYLPGDAKRESIRQMTPKETGEHLAKEILATTREALAG